jgi:hypothetical protein
MLLCGNETRAWKKRDWNRIQAEELQYLRNVKSFPRTHQLRDEDIRNYLGTFLVSKKFTGYRENGKYICKGWDRIAFHFMPLNFARLVDETEEYQE